MSWWLACVLLALGVYYYIRKRRSLWLGDQGCKCVFITGCDTGFGNGLAIRLDKKGIPVFAGCFTEKGAKELMSKCSSKLQTVIVDVTKTESIQAAYNYVSTHIPHKCELWGIVNNAGTLGLDGPTEFFSKDDYLFTYKINFLGMTDVNKIFLPLIKKSQGRIVNMASMSSLMCFPTLAPYAASKHAVLAYSDTLRLEKSVWGIKVSTIEPWGYKTAILDPDKHIKAKHNQWDQLPEDIQTEYGEEYLKKEIEAKVKWQMKDAPTDLNPVLNAYEHALFAVHPKAHYLPDLISRIFYLIYLLPRPVYEYVFARSLVVRRLPEALRKKSS